MGLYRIKNGRRPHLHKLNLRLKYINMYYNTKQVKSVKQLARWSTNEFIACSIQVIYELTLFFLFPYF